MEQVFVKVLKVVVKKSSRNLQIGALAAAGAQSTQFHESPEKVENGHQKCHFGEVQGADFDIFGGAGLILAVIWEACFQRTPLPESREGRGGTPRDS